MELGSRTRMINFAPLDATPAPSEPLPTWSDPGEEDIDAVVVTEMSQAEFDAATKRALDRLQLTYDQLRDEAERRDFSSLEARKLWLAFTPVG